MYPLGVLLGLGFDTLEVVLGIATIQGAAGTSILLFLVFSGMAIFRIYCY